MSENLRRGLFRLKFQALGTVCEIQFRAASVEVAKEFRKATLGWLREYEAKWSRFKPDSLLCQINAKAGVSPVEITEEDEEILRLCDHAYRISDGLHDPTSFPLTALWDQAEKKGRFPSDLDISKTKKLVSWPLVEWGKGKISLPMPGMALEIGGFGKEYAVDRLVEFARQFRIDDCLVDLGRDISAIGTPPHGPAWVLGVEDARMKDAASFRLAVSGKGLATSGNERRYRLIGGKKFGHIIDPRSGWPAATEVITASCLADDCLTAGLFSTSACILGMTDGMKVIEQTIGLEAILQGSEQTLFSSRIHHSMLGS